MREFFLLDEAFAFLNHGSFGACPKPVFEGYQHWQLEVERQPVAFFQRRMASLLDESRSVVADYLTASPDDIHFVRNATVGMNIIARSVALQPGDEVLTTHHEYGAVDAIWQFICEKHDAQMIRQNISLPYISDDDFVDRLWAGVTERTRIILISHITSPTALTLPVAAVCRRAREAGIITVIDGAHVPGHIQLDLTALDADYYTGNFHKWLCAPRSAGFLHTNREHQHTLYPLIVSWGWIREDTPVGKLQWKGTEDLAAYLAVPDAIHFQAVHDWNRVRQHCHTLAIHCRNQLIDLFNSGAASPDENVAQMFIAELPTCDPVATQDRLYHEFRVEVPIIDWQGRQFVRVSVQGYNTSEDTARLVNALQYMFT